MDSVLVKIFIFHILIKGVLQLFLLMNGMERLFNIIMYVVSNSFIAIEMYKSFRVVEIFMEKNYTLE